VQEAQCGGTLLGYYRKFHCDRQKHGHGHLASYIAGDPDLGAVLRVCDRPRLGGPRGATSPGGRRRRRAWCVGDVRRVEMRGCSCSPHCLCQCHNGLYHVPVVV
jgi:hypothetical protein